MNNIDQILTDNYQQLEKLKSELNQIENIRKRFEELKNSNEKLPEEFQVRFQLIVDHAAEYNKNLGNSVKLFVEGNNTLLVENILEISNKTNKLGSEINRLVEFSLDDSFKELGTHFLENSKHVINQELIKFDDKATNIQNKINAFSEEITRLSKIDLESHFNNHQSKLSEVFISVNGINGIISNISQNLNKIIHNLGEIEQSILNNKRELLSSINNLQQYQDTVINKLSKNMQSNHQKILTSFQESDNKLDSIISYNQSLKKDLKLNKIIGFVLIFLILVTLILVLVKNF
jgi:acyl carrier protein phosphodiesterase